MPPADDNILNLSAKSDGDSEDDDYIPESLRAFVMEAENALADQQMDFFSEVAPSPTNANNTTADSADIDASRIQLGAIQTEMEKVTIEDKAEAAAKKAEKDRRAAKEAADKKSEEERISKEEAAKAEVDRLAKELAAQKLEEERLEKELSDKKAEEERVSKELAQKVEEEKIAKELADKKAEEERIAKEAAAKAEEERIAKELAAKKLEEERLAKELADKKAEEERIAKEAAQKTAEEARIAKEEEEKIARELAAKKAAEERLAKELADKKVEEERIAKEAAQKKAEEERLARELANKNAEEERIARELAAKKAEEHRLAKELADKKAEEERIARELAAKKAEEQRLTKELAAKKAEEERIARELAAKKAEEERVAKVLADKKAEEERIAQKLEEEMLAAQKLEEERLAKEAEAARMATEEAAASPSGGFTGFFGRIKQQVAGPSTAMDESQDMDITADASTPVSAYNGLADAMEGLEIVTDTAESSPKATPTQSSAKQNGHSSKLQSQPKTPTAAAGGGILVSPAATSPSSSTKRSSPLAPTSRLFKDTSATKAHKDSAEKRQDTNKKRVASTSRTRGTGIPKPTVRSPITFSGHFMMPTEAKRAHERDHSSPPTEGSPTKKRAGRTVPHVSSRLLKGTAATSAARRARESKATPSTSFPQKRSSDEAVARARERIRQRKMAEKTLSTYSNESGVKFSVGTKSPAKSKPTRQWKANTKPLAHFAVATSSYKAHHSPPNVSLAKTSDVFGKGLRSDISPSSRSSTNKTGPTLTIPKTPRFATTARCGKKVVRKDDTGPRDTATVVQSLNFEKQLREPSPALNVKRTTKLTQPQAPKFHTIHKRPLPKGAAEIEAEEVAKMKNFRSHPYKPNEKALHTGSSAGLTKVRKRTLTKPAPFNLSGGACNTTKATGMQDEENNGRDANDSGGRKKQFRARAMPNFSSSAGVKAKARTVTVPQPFKFSVDMKNKSPSKNKGSGRSPRGFKARPVPKSLRKGPSIPVHTIPTPSPDARKQRGPPPIKGPTTPRPPTTPEPFKLESVNRHETFQVLLNEKLKVEEEEFRRGLVPKALPLPETTYRPSVSPPGYNLK